MDLLTLAFTVAWVLFIGTTVGVIGSLAFLTRKHGLAWKLLHKMYIGLLLLVAGWVVIWLTSGQYDPGWPTGFLILSGMDALICLLPASILFPRGWRDVFRSWKQGITQATPKKKGAGSGTVAPSSSRKGSSVTSKPQPARPYNHRNQSHKKYLQPRR